jgi:hypothetical protein
MRTPGPALVVALLCALACPARAGQADAQRLQGVFTNPAQSEEVIDAAIEAAVGQLNFAARPFARARLKKVNLALRRVEIARNGDGVAITLGTATPVVATPGAGAVKWMRDDGDVFDVVVTWEEGTLVQTATSGESHRTNRFSLSADGAVLTMAVTLTGPQLHVPARYQLTFRRETGRIVK